jgi:proline dehydrogenase
MKTCTRKINTPPIAVLNLYFCKLHLWSMLSFENTEIAFKYRSNAELSKAYWLFKLIGSNTLVKLSKPLAYIAVRLALGRYIIRKTIYAHFCGGIDIEDCEKTINTLDTFGIGTILDYSVEGKESEEDFERTFNEITETQNRAQLDDKVPFCVFKLTGIARFGLLEKVSEGKELTESERHEFDRVRQRVERLCKKAFEENSRIMMDAEETWIQPVMDQLILDMMRKYNRERAVVYNTYQMYRHDRLDVLKEWHEMSINEGFKVGVKLVRGAYMEKERQRSADLNYTDPIQATKQNTDNDYNKALEFIVRNIDSFALCAGTHNEESSLLLTALMSDCGLKPKDERIYFSQLLGMSDPISFNLAHAGYNVAKYVPYGPVADVLPYLMRRADENTSVAGQTGRELNLLLKEKKRRAGKL